MKESVILIEYGAYLYALWCQTCGVVHPVRREQTQLTCTGCDKKVGEPLPADYVKHLQEGGSRH
jgi:hypothetical protein